MGAYSTLRITRAKALEIYYSKITPAPSKEVLERIMDDLLEDRLYNCVIVGDDMDNDNNELPWNL